MNRTGFSISSVLGRLVSGRDAIGDADTDVSGFNSMRTDYLKWIGERELLHIEFQTRDEGNMPTRMFLYHFAIRSRFGNDVKINQVVLRLDGEPGLHDVPHLILHPYREFTFTARQVDDLMESADIVDNVMAAFYAGDDRSPYMEILDRIGNVADRAERASLLSRFSVIVSWKTDSLPAEAMERLREMTMADLNKIEGNFYLETIAEAVRTKGLAEGRAEGRAEGLAEGEMRGKLIAKAEIFGAPPMVEETIRTWPIDDLSSLDGLIEAARESGDWSFEAPRPGNGR